MKTRVRTWVHRQCSVWRRNRCDVWSDNNFEEGHWLCIDWPGCIFDSAYTLPWCRQVGVARCDLRSLVDCTPPNLYKALHVAYFVYLPCILSTTSINWEFNKAYGNEAGSVDLLDVLGLSHCVITAGTFYLITICKLQDLLIEQHFLWISCTDLSFHIFLSSSPGVGF